MHSLDGYRVCKRGQSARRSAVDRVFGFPGPGEQVIETAVGMAVDHFLKDIAKVGVGFDAVELGGLCRTPNYAERPSRS